MLMGRIFQWPVLTFTLCSLECHAARLLAFDVDLLNVRFAGKDFILSFILSFAAWLRVCLLRHSPKVAVN